MSIDFSKYQNIILKFRGEANKPSFDIKFTQSTKHIAKTEKFLLKMELKRLASACNRSIDLRGLVDGECKIFDYSGQSHFLDDIAVKVFEENVEAYKGYTFGVYDAVKNTENNFRVIYQKEQKNLDQTSNIEKQTDLTIKSAEKTQYPVTIYPLNQYHDRKEERMNFVVPLDIYIDSNNTKSVSSIDISLSGIKFRFSNKVPLYIDQKINIYFKGLEGEFQFDENEKLVYQVKNINGDSKTQIIGCQRIEFSENDPFQQFLKNYIQSNKRRYKVNIDNTISALQSRTFEHFILPKMSELPIFFEYSNAIVKPKYVLTTNNNQSVFQYWQDENNHSNLHSLVDTKRLARLIENHKKNKPLLVYSFIHENQGKDFFYTIDEKQLAEDENFAMSFLAFAAKRKSFAVTQLTYFKTSLSSIFTPFTISNTQELHKHYINLPPSNAVGNCIKTLSFAVVANDVTHKSSLEQYQGFSNGEIDVSKLKQYGHKRLKEKLVVEEFGVAYKKQRLESRYKYQTPLSFDCGKKQANGELIDFSISGLKLELNNGLDVSLGDKVNVSFPNLQKITSSHNLNNLPYEIVKINKAKTIMSLRTYIKEHQHAGRSFFKLLIENNKDKLIIDEYTSQVPGLAKALRTHYANNLQIPALIVQTSGSRYKIESLVSNNETTSFLSKLNDLSDRKKYYNFYPIFKKLYKDNFLETCLKKLVKNAEPISDILYISIAKKIENISNDVTVKNDAELNTQELRKAFIKESLNKGSFFCFQLKITRTEQPDLEYLNTELNYISSFAIHRSKQIEQDIMSVVASIQYVDITHETLYSHRT